MRDKDKLFRAELKKPRSKHIKELYDKILSGEATVEDVESVECRPWVKKILRSELESASKMVEDVEAKSRAEKIANIMRAETEHDSELEYRVYRYYGPDREISGKNGRMFAEIKYGNCVLEIGGSSDAIRINQLYFEPDFLWQLIYACEYVGDMTIWEYNSLVQKAIREGENGLEVKQQDAIDRVDQRIASTFNFRRM